MNSTSNAAPTSAARTPLVDAGLALVRIGLAVVLIAHGAQKLFDYGISGVSGAFAEAGIPAAGAAATVAALVEFVGGIAMLLGIGSRAAGVLVAAQMAVAILTMHLGAGFFADAGGMELPLLVATTALGLALSGPGRFSLAGLLFRSRTSLIA